MPLEIPTILEESDALTGELARVVGAPTPKKSVVRILANALAGSVATLYRYGARRHLDWFPAHASYDEVTILGRTFRPLLEAGRLRGVTDPTAAVRTRLAIGISTTALGGTLDAGTRLVCDDNGVEYMTVIPVALDSSDPLAVVVAVEDRSGGGGYGAVGNVPNGTVLRFVSSMDDVELTAEVVSTLTTGSDAESWESYRRRVLTARRDPPPGGWGTDYRRWARSVDGVDEAFPYESTPPSTIDVYIRAEAGWPGSTAGVPPLSLLTAVQDYIDEADDDGLPLRRPINDGVRVLPISRVDVGVTIYGLAVTDHNAVSAAMTDALSEYAATREPFILGVSQLPRKDRITNAEVSAVASQVAASFGGTITSVEVEIEGVVDADYTLTGGEHATLALPVLYST